MDKDSYIRNARISGNTFGDVFCKKCGERIAYIEKESYKHIYLVAICGCGEEVIVILPGKPAPERKRNRADKCRGLTCCRRCGRRLIYIDSRKIRKASFRAACECGKMNAEVVSGDCLKGMSKR